jgi:hypothetical protein
VAGAEVSARPWRSQPRLRSKRDLQGLPSVEAGDSRVMHAGVRYREVLYIMARSRAAAILRV